MAASTMVTSFVRALVVLQFATLVSAHGSMGTPPSRNMHGLPPKCINKGGKKYCDAGCSHEACLWYQVGCMVGCDECSLDGKEMWPTPAHVSCKRNGSLVPPGKTPFPVPRTVPPAARTWNMDGKSRAGDFTKYMPWTSPGASPITDSCGVASGFRQGSPFGKGVPSGYKGGDLGSAVLKPLLNKTVISAGGEFEAGFGLEVNHGGGYSYRLCPVGETLTEACFQANVLEFAGPNHTIKYIDGSRPDLQIPAMTISTGTTPAGSQWRRLPFPACNCDLGEGCYWDEDKCTGEADAMCAYEQQANPPPRCPTGVQFPVPAEDLYGYGDVPPVLITDTLKVPASLAKGDYVLSWRWDCEQTPQIWNTCADLTVV